MCEAHARAREGRAGAAPPREVAVVGLGLVGGSLARALLAAGYPVVGADVSEVACTLATGAGIRAVPSPHGLPDALARAHTVVLAVPVDQVAPTAAAVLAYARPEACVLHTGSLQRRAALAMDAATHERTIGTHPLAGTAAGGFAASDPTLFRGARVSVEERAGAAPRAAAEAIWRGAGAAVVEYRTGDEHDSLMAWLSHLPQLAATALAATLSEAGVEGRHGGPGVRDSTRLAASPLEMWRGILRAAPPETRQALASLETNVSALRRALEADDHATLESVWRRARSWRGRLDSGA